ncbi:MAG TPA: menaquinone biosynthesis protein [Longimicrobiales bacterium]|nr:menaquinone biosynthesis protein [Longimicrobiales bacterium]
MIRLGHIDYSNCIPVHALLLERPPAGVALMRDIPSRLNAALAAGVIDAAPCSSIEYARHAADYRILPAHAIGSAGAVQSILLETTVPPERLAGLEVAVPTASATSVVLLRALLELRLGVRPRYRWFEQGSADPIETGAAAALRIGDVALTRVAPPGRLVLDLGAEWFAWTGLPFAFAVWQVRRAVPAADVRALVELLGESRAWWAADPAAHARRHAPHFGLTPERLLDYWASLRFDLDAAMQRGLLHFYDLAAELGEAPRTGALDIVPVGQD